MQLHVPSMTCGNDNAFFMLHLMVTHFRYMAKIVNMETTSLYGELEEEIHVECPQGMSDAGKDDCIILNM